MITTTSTVTTRQDLNHRVEPQKWPLLAVLLYAYSKSMSIPICIVNYDHSQCPRELLKTPDWFVNEALGRSSTLLRSPGCPSLHFWQVRQPS